MIQAICGVKGSGKTKRLIDIANDAIKTEKGDIVFIDDDARYMYDLRHEVRFVNAGEYDIQSADAFYGLISGILSQNFDVSLIVVDALMKLTKTPIEGTGALFNQLAKLAEVRGVNLVLSLSGDPESAPDNVKQYII